MINKKLSDLFLRKESRKEEPKKIECFDQNYFHCQLTSRAINTDLVRVQGTIKENGQSLDEMKCKWFLKNSRDFKEIEDVVSSYYQPCLDDVGSIVCVQIEPFIEGKQYIGITIMKQSETIKLDPQLQNKLQCFLNSGKLKLDGRIQAIFSQDEKYEYLQLPLEIKVQIQNSAIVLLAGGVPLQKVAICQQFPNIEFIRKSFNSILYNYNQRQSMKISFNNNFDRDLFTLVVRTCVASAESVDINPEQEPANEVMIEEEKSRDKHEIDKEQEQENQKQGKQDIQKEAIIESKSIQSIEEGEPVKKDDQILVKSQRQLQLQKSKDKIQQKVNKTEDKQNNTMLVLKIDEIGKELKNMKRKYDQLQINYNLEKINKTGLETSVDSLSKQLHTLKKQHEETLTVAKKVKQLNQDNRFYKNEISIIRKELKASKGRVQFLQKKLATTSNQQIAEYEAKLVEARKETMFVKDSKMQLERQRQSYQGQIDRLKGELQAIENENLQLKKKLQSLISQRQPIPTKHLQKEKGKELKIEQDKVKELQMKLKNLQMLLRYKSQGQVSSNFQMLVNKLTETITQRELQLSQLRKINKNLLEQLKQARQNYTK